MCVAGLVVGLHHLVGKAAARQPALERRRHPQFVLPGFFHRRGALGAVLLFADLPRPVDGGHAGVVVEVFLEVTRGALIEGLAALNDVAVVLGDTDNEVHRALLARNDQGVLPGAAHAVQESVHPGFQDHVRHHRVARADAHILETHGRHAFEEALGLPAQRRRAHAAVELGIDARLLAFEDGVAVVVQPRIHPDLAGKAVVLQAAAPAPALR